MHQQLADRRVNRVNTRREFFYATPTEARELLMLLGVERYGLKVNALGRELRKTPDGMSQTLARAVRRRAGDDEFLRRINELDRQIADGEGG